MKFSSTRVDGLVRRVNSPSDVTEMFEGRSDFLYSRHVVYKQGPDVDNRQVKGLIRVKTTKCKASHTYGAD